MKNKILKNALITIGCLLSLVIVVCLGIIINGSCFTPYKDKNDHSKWMENINDETLVNEIVIPGSHDAGSYGMVWLGETQQFDIDKQLKAGVRYFDLRVNKLEDRHVIFHSVINGVDFLPILKSIQQFVIDNPSETLLLDFQHFSNDSQEDVYNFIIEYLYSDNLLVINDKDISDLEFINNLKLKDARGKCIVFWGDRNSDDKDLLFFRNNDECTYSNMSLNSYYISDYHYKNYEYLVNNGYPIYFENIKNKIESEGKGIFVLQAQLTDNNLIFGPYSKEKTNTNKISEYIKSFKDKEELNYLNVIMRDFLDASKCEEIIELNNYKGNNK